MNRPPLLVAAFVAAASLTALGAALVPASARAATIADLAVEVDADAAVYLAARPDAIPGVFAWLRRLPSGGPGAPLRAYADRVATTTTTVLGFDATGSWDASGLDLGSPILVGLGAFDLPAVEAAFAARDAKPGDKKALGKAPRVFVRTRLVAAVADEGKLRGVLGRAAAAGGALALAGAPPATLGALFGGDAKLGKVVAASLKKMKAAAVCRWGAHVAFVRTGGGRLVIDAYWIFAEDGIDPRRDLPALAKLSARKLKAASPLFAGPGSAGLAEARVAALVDPVRLVDLGRVGGWGNTWRAAAGMPDVATARSALDTGTKEVAQCLPFRKLAAEGPLAAFVLTARPTATGVAIDVTWPLRSVGALAAELATSDDGLVDLAAAKDAKLLALLPLADLAGLKQLGKGTIYAQRAALDEATLVCGYGAVVSRLLVGGLHELGDFMASHPQFGPLLADARNVAVAVRTLDVRGQAPPQLVALASNVGQVRHRDLDGNGKRSAKSAGKRKLDAWIDARDPRAPWVVASPGVDPQQTIYGVVWGGDQALAWWWGQPSPAQTGGTTAFVMLVRAELPWFLGVAEALGLGRGLGDLGNGLGTLRALLTLKPDALGAAITVDVK